VKSGAKPYAALPGVRRRWTIQRINLEDIPRLTDEQLANMVRLRDARPRKVAVSVRLDARVLTWLRFKGEGHLTRINDILKNLMEAEQRTRPGR
jgi:uncharacterized protein (DUF4415 family)